MTIKINKIVIKILFLLVNIMHANYGLSIPGLDLNTTDLRTQDTCDLHNDLINKIYIPSTQGDIVNYNNLASDCTSRTLCFGGGWAAYNHTSGTTASGSFRFGCSTMYDAILNTDIIIAMLNRLKDNNHCINDDQCISDDSGKLDELVDMHINYLNSYKNNILNRNDTCDTIATNYFSSDSQALINLQTKFSTSCNLSYYDFRDINGDGKQDGYKIKNKAGVVIGTLGKQTINNSRVSGSMYYKCSLDNNKFKLICNGVTEDYMLVLNDGETIEKTGEYVMFNCCNDDNNYIYSPAKKNCLKDFNMYLHDMMNYVDLKRTGGIFGTASPGYIPGFNDSPGVTINTKCFIIDNETCEFKCERGYSDSEKCSIVTNSNNINSYYYSQNSVDAPCTITSENSDIEIIQTNVQE